MNLLVAAQPGELALGIVARTLLHQRRRGMDIAARCQAVDVFFIADCLHGGRRRGNAGGKQRTDFVQQPVLQHALDAQVDAVI